MKTVYQIFVKGSYDCVADVFKASSQKVYSHYPTDSEIKEFIDKCIGDGTSFFNLDPKEDYKVTIVELTVID